MCRRRGKSQLSWEEFVDGAISLSAAVMLSDALATPEGELELKELSQCPLIITIDSGD